MNSKLGSLVAALAMAFGSAAPAGTLAPTLQHAIKLAGDQGDLPVIVQFAEQVDVEALRLDAARTAQSLFPDDTKKSTKEPGRCPRVSTASTLAPGGPEKEEIDCFSPSTRSSKSVGPRSRIGRPLPSVTTISTSTSRTSRA